MDEEGEGKQEPNRKPDELPQNNGMSNNLIKALGHPLRRRILRTLDVLEEARSPAELRTMFGLHISPVSYHVKVLRDCKAIVLTDTRQVRGALEHFYASTVTNNQSVALLLKATQAEDEAS